MGLREGGDENDNGFLPFFAGVKQRPQKLVYDLAKSGEKAAELQAQTDGIVPEEALGCRHAIKKPPRVEMVFKYIVMIYFASAFLRSATSSFNFLPYNDLATLGDNDLLMVSRYFKLMS